MNRSLSRRQGLLLCCRCWVHIRRWRTRSQPLHPRSNPALAFIVTLAGFTFLATSCRTVQLFAQEPAAGFGRTIAELASGLRPIEAQSATASLAMLELRDGFRATVVAAEPQVRDPVAIAFDEMGRMFVVELPAYNAYAAATSTSGSIRTLEDTNHDGRYDKSTLYAADLGYPTGLACWEGGLFVGAAPDLLYLRDTDGDGTADERRVVLTGFGTDDSGEGQLNSFRWGFDNRIHISTGLDGGMVRPAGTTESAGVSVRGRGLILDPRDGTFELTSGGGQHGMSLDDWGRKYVCENSVPAQVLVYDDRYIARNPNLRAPPAAVDICPAGKFTTLFRISPEEPWRELRTQLRSEGRFRGSAEGGKPFGFFTGATGITVYRGDAWPAEYRGNIFVGDVANNLVYRAQVESDAVGLVARRADPGREFAASRDIWFRPVQFENAPDGNLYMIDMYRGLIEGAAFLPTEFLSFIDPVGGNKLGRIYRIAIHNSRRRAIPQLGESSTADLISLLEHPNAWHRDSASRLLFERQDPASIAGLRRLVTKSISPVGRMTALYALAGQRRVEEADLVAALEDEAALVKVHALRLVEQVDSPGATLVAKMCSLAADSDVRVRYQLAFSLGSVDGPNRDRALVQILTGDGSNEWIRIAVQSSLAHGADRILDALIAEPGFRQTAHGKELLPAIAEMIGRAGRTNELQSTARTIVQLANANAGLAADLAESFLLHQPPKSRRATLATAPTLGSLLQQRLLVAKQTTVSDREPVEKRVSAVGTLRLADFDDMRSICEQLLEIRQPLAVQLAALELMVEYEELAVAHVILTAWPALSPTVRAHAAEVVLARPQWIPLLLDEVASGRVARGDIEPARVALLKEHSDEAIAERVQLLFAEGGLAARATIVQQFEAALNQTGDPKVGKEVFQKVCSSCHQLEGIGKSVGADLRGIGARGRPAILLNILDPNRELKPKFLTYSVATSDGRVLTGMIESESANSLQIRQADGTTVSLLRSEIDELRGTGVSFMPEGLEKELNIKSMADLLAYLITQSSG